MGIFKKTEIKENNELIADALKLGRQEKKIGLKQASKTLGINLRYLKYLETGDFNKLPTGIYRKNFLREYAIFLDLNAEKLVDLFQDKNDNQPTNDKQNIFSRKIPAARYFLTFPKIIKNTIITGIVIICLSYLGYSIINIIKPPTLTVTNPAKDITIVSRIINIEGIAEKEARILINNEEVLIDNEGAFNKLINLKKGVNTISIKASKKYSQESIIIRKILVEN